MSGLPMCLIVIRIARPHDRRQGWELLLHSHRRSGLLKSMKFEDYITITPEVRSGKPCIKGTRITVADVLDYLAGGMTEVEILADFPALKPEHIRACLAFAAARERRLASHRAA